jgi:hypothetical protein
VTKMHARVQQFFYSDIYHNFPLLRARWESRLGRAFLDEPSRGTRD